MAVQRGYFPECNPLLVLHAAPRNSPKACDCHSAVEWYFTSSPLGQIPGPESVVESAVAPQDLASLGAECVC